MNNKHYLPNCKSWNKDTPKKLIMEIACSINISYRFTLNTNTITLLQSVIQSLKVKLVGLA